MFRFGRALAETRRAARRQMSIRKHCDGWPRRDQRRPFAQFESVIAGCKARNVEWAKQLYQEKCHLTQRDRDPVKRIVPHAQTCPNHAVWPVLGPSRSNGAGAASIGGRGRQAARRLRARSALEEKSDRTNFLESERHRATSIQELSWGRLHQATPWAPSGISAPSG